MNILSLLGSCQQVVEDLETTEPCRLYRVKNCYKLCSFWRFVDTGPIVRPRLRTHFADILNSQLMYTVQLLIIKAVLPWYSHFRKHGFFCGFAVQISVASSIALFISLKVRIAYNAPKTASIAAEQRAWLLFPARNSIWDLFAGRFVNASSIV